jgi:Cdc6-like AAA superfamily ATPase
LFFNENIANTLSGFLYICGHPGTGKTTLLSQVLREITDENENVHSIKLNAMSFKDFLSLLNEIINRAD